MKIALIVLFLITSFLIFKEAFYFLYLKTLIPHHIPHLDVREFREFKQDTILILDTRSLEEYQVSHIKGAQWVGYDEFTLDKIDTFARDTTVVLYCSVGYRSDIVGKKLQEAGFQRVYNLWGGIFAWVNEEMPVYQEDKITKKIHPYSSLWGFWLTKGEKVLP
ncbi:rhodanese-like domain-containing protein [Catalinimonas niigatensis]|uniref:rhodanese-like domain-containing protein n=1 Tax=Catalinimonas niigatensis TaxID=1397264 RepID=UPI00266586CB|nr:rhodanese-like domain-containing protein [Catalinimonas niigatensis]WPP52758.1 rhodanese-like domain-containing protein [Catalinimonas niigatensis]